ncbi:MauE/DoxX family redox-associated membrane protein [Actinomadura gamaensis]|uniref:MauE/DoxX family redox-associated membrane protein n=1 Tax=Actinomadura gamaensis TaxID=1763541 RepID=A0ABV9U447_9ACTN
MSDSSAAVRGLAGLLVSAGTMHLLAPRPFDAIVPRSLPGPARAWTYASGVAEIACGVAVAVPRTRRAGALATAALFAGVFPANVKMARDWRDKPLPLRAAAYGRLPLQAPLVAWALRVARRAR